MPVNFNGVYQTKCKLGKGQTTKTRYYLRFYPDGKIIGVSTECDAEAIGLKNWFFFENKKIEYLDIGSYKIVGKNIEFLVTNPIATIKYNGIIKKDRTLKLKAENQINGSIIYETFDFLEVDNLK